MMNEILSEFKTTEDLICEHCGSIIPKGSYFEEFRKANYHIECIWDKLINHKSSNEYELAREFFFSLKQYIGDWPAYGYDIEDSYVSDLELVQHNDRTVKYETFVKVISEVRPLLEDEK
jgi:hypothetical protein